MKQLHKETKDLVKTLKQLTKQVETLTKMIIEIETKEKVASQSKPKSSKKIRQRILIPKPAKRKKVARKR